MLTSALISLAFGDLGVFDITEAIPAESVNDAFTRLNLLVDSLQLDPPWLYQRVRVVQNLTTNQATYTIGIGGQINVHRPDFPPDQAGLIINTGSTTLVEIPVEVFTDARWYGLQIKTLASALVRGIWIDFANAAGLATLNVWPVPNVGTTALVLYLPGVAVGQFADLNTTDYTFPPGYLLAIEKSLAMTLAVPYGRQPPPQLVSDYRDAMARIHRANAANHLVELTCADAALMSSGDKGTGWNYRTGTYGR